MFFRTAAQAAMRRRGGNNFVAKYKSLLATPGTYLVLPLLAALRDFAATYLGVFAAILPQSPCFEMYSLTSGRVYTAPGSTAHTVTPVPPHSYANACENEVSAPFDEAYTAKYGVTNSPASEDMGAHER